MGVGVTGGSRRAWHAKNAVATEVVRNAYFYATRACLPP